MNTKLSLVSCALIASLTGIAQADISVDWYRTTAPNAFGAGSYDQFWLNAQNSVINLGGADHGTGNEAFTNITEVNGVQSYVTSFESLDGAFVADEYGVRPSWVYYISNDDGSLMDNSLLASATKNYSYSWDGVEESFFGDLAYGDLVSTNRLGVKADGSVSTDMNGEYVGFIGISGNSWWATDWTGTLGVDHEWIDGDYMVGDPDRFDKLAQLGDHVEAHQDFWSFSLNFGGQEFYAPNINVVPAPASLALLGLGGLVSTRRRR